MVHVFLVVVPALVDDHVLHEAWVNIFHELMPILIDLFWLVEFCVLEIWSIMRLFDRLLKLILHFFIDTLDSFVVFMLQLV